MPVPVVAAARRGARRARDMALHVAGGPARMRVVLTLAAVLGLSGADTGTISSTTGNLERAFHLGNTQIGVLLSVVGLVGAVFTIPAGIPGSSAGAAGGSGGGQTGNPTGLEYTFLVFLVPLVAAGLLALAALRTHPRDVATASASVRAVEDAGKDEEPGGRRAA
jgi:hypothetical protein